MAKDARYLARSDIRAHIEHRHTTAGSVRHAVRRVSGRHPGVFMPMARRRHPQSALANDTQIVIDGPTCSAGTFALIAFQAAQNAHVRAAHHLHVPAHIMAAAEAHVPTLVPIRAPRDSVLSSVIRQPDVSIAEWLRSFCDFHRKVQPLGPAVVFASFKSVTNDLGSVIHEINDRFGTSFAEFRHTTDQVELVFSLIDERARRPPWQQSMGDFLNGRISLDEYRSLTAGVRSRTPVDDIPETRVQRPSTWRTAMKARLGEHYDAPSLAGLRHRAEDAYAATALQAC